MLIDQQERGVEWPEVAPSLIDIAMSKPPLPPHERAYRLLWYLSNQTSELGEPVELAEYTYEAYAWSESTKWAEIQYLVRYLKQTGCVEGQSSVGAESCALTVEGYGRIAEQRINVDSSQAFVAMWFHDSLTSAYDDGIEPGIRDAGYKPLKIDQKEHINKIEDEIIAEVRRSRFLVADFTHGEDGARGGVYYEAGFAHGLGLDVVFICRKDFLKRLHFDTSHFSHIAWSDPADLREKLRNRILHVIGPGPGLHTSP